MLSIYLFSGYYAIIEQHVNQRQNYTYVETVFLFSIVVFKRCSVFLNESKLFKANSHSQWPSIDHDSAQLVWPHSPLLDKSPGL